MRTIVIAIFAGVLLTGLAVPAAAGKKEMKYSFPSETERQEFIRVFREKIVGRPPEAVDPAMSFDRSETADGYTLHHVSYNVDADERVKAYLLVPDHEAGTKLPLIFCLHPTHRIGKDVMINRYPAPATDGRTCRNRENRANALELVRRGFACFIPDRSGFGERSPLPENPDAFKNLQKYKELHQRKYPGWSYNYGKIPFDLSRALDALEKLDYIDADRIGTIGHSLGGWDSLCFYGSDPRVRAAVVNSGGAHMFHQKLWLDQEWRLKFASGKTDIVPGTDVVGQIMLITGAPRPMLYMRDTRDIGTDYPDMVMDNIRLIRAFYRNFGENPYRIYGRDQFAMFTHNNGHDFPPFARALAWSWLEYQLKR